MKYLVVGTGGVGGSIAGFLAQAGRDVTCIARGAHLEAIRRDGLVLESDIKQQTTASKMKAFTAEEYVAMLGASAMTESERDAMRPDVIIVSVKGYSLDSIAGVVQAAARRDTLVIPILNVYGTGPRLSRLVHDVTVLDGCIYIVGFVTGAGRIRQMGNVFNLVFGARPEQGIAPEVMDAVADDLRATGIHVRVSDDINRDTFVKWGFISAMACTGAFHDCPMGPLQHEGEERATFVGLCRESQAIGEAMGIPMPADYVEHNLKVIDHLAPESTASMQKDLARQHESEIEGQLFEMERLGRRLGVEMPVYERVCAKFRDMIGK